jgi:hypothetical protein
MDRASIGLGALLTSVFIVLKLLGMIPWSWLWVLSPSWIIGAFWFFFIAVMGLIYLGRD